jgi:hypothetical protein
MTNRMIQEESLATADEGIDLARPDYSRKPSPLPAPGRFKTLLRLRSWAGERFPRATLVTDGLDLRAWNRIAPVLDSLAMDWPGVARELGWITTRHSLWGNQPKGAIAAAESISGEKIAFNPFCFQSLRKIRRVVRKGVREGFYPRGVDLMPMDYLLSHEWAHLVAASLGRHDNERWNRILGLFARDTMEHTSSFDPAKAARISITSEASFAEALAEAFAAIRCQPESFQPEIVRRLSRVLRG